MKSKTFIITLFLLALAGNASAQWFENGKLSSLNSWRKNWGTNGGAVLYLTDKPNALFRNWGKPGVRLSATEIAKRGKPIVGVIIFAGCSKDDEGHCNTSVSFQVFKPDGLPYGTKEHGELWIGKPAPQQGTVQLSIGAIGVNIEPNDPNGIYTVRAHLHDKISKNEVELIRTFQVFPDK